MTKPRITASMLRKRPKPAEPETAPQAETAAEETEDAFAGQPAQAGSMLDNPSFRAPQFGIKPRVPAVEGKHESLQTDGTAQVDTTEKPANPRASPNCRTSRCRRVGWGTRIRT